MRCGGKNEKRHFQRGDQSSPARVAVPTFSHHLHLPEPNDTVIPRLRLPAFSLGMPYDPFLVSFGLLTHLHVQMIARHMWSHFQPWVNTDVETLKACLPVGVREGPYVALHIRRGDKLVSEAELVPVVNYLELAVKSLVEQYMACRDSQSELETCQGRSHPLPCDIRGIYVASDDSSVVEEVRKLVPNHFPNIAPDEIVFVSDGKANCTLGVHEVATRVYKQVRGFIVAGREFNS